MNARFLCATARCAAELIEEIYMASARYTNWCVINSSLLYQFFKGLIKAPLRASTLRQGILIFCLWGGETLWRSAVGRDYQRCIGRNGRCHARSRNFRENTFEQLTGTWKRGDIYDRSACDIYCLLFQYYYNLLLGLNLIYEPPVCLLASMHAWAQSLAEAPSFVGVHWTS